MGSQGFNFTIDDAARTTMQDRGIREEDIAEVLDYAAESSLYLRAADGKTNLAKKRIGNFTLYVEYSPDDANRVTDVYSHRISLNEDVTE